MHWILRDVVARAVHQRHDQRRMRIPAIEQHRRVETRQRFRCLGITPQVALIGAEVRNIIKRHTVGSEP